MEAEPLAHLESLWGDRNHLASYTYVVERGHAIKRSIGFLTIVDKEVMDTENTARHALGLSHVALTKASALADEFQKLVPGIEVKGANADGRAWLTKNATPNSFDLVVDWAALRLVQASIALALTT